MAAIVGPNDFTKSFIELIFSLFFFIQISLDF